MMSGIVSCWLLRQHWRNGYIGFKGWSNHFVFGLILRIWSTTKWPRDWTPDRYGGLYSVTDSMLLSPINQAQRMLNLISPDYSLRPLNTSCVGGAVTGANVLRSSAGLTHPSSPVTLELAEQYSWSDTGSGGRQWKGCDWLCHCLIRVFQKFQKSCLYQWAESAIRCNNWFIKKM